MCTCQSHALQLLGPHDAKKIIFIYLFTDNHFEKSGLTAIKQIMFQEKRIAHLHFTGNRTGKSRFMKIPFTTLHKVTVYPIYKSPVYHVPVNTQHLTNPAFFIYL